VSLLALLIALGLIKLVVASMMLWLPFRSDAAMIATGDPPRLDSDDDDDDGGSKVALAEPCDPHPRRPSPRPRSRGPHGAPSPPAPRRIRTVSPRLPVRARSLKS
jgi:hypothetical protein